MSNIQNAEETALTTNQKTTADVRDKVTGAKEVNEKILKRPISVIVGAVLTCIMPLVYSAVLLLLPNFRESPLMLPVLGMFMVIVIASICVIWRKAKARYVVAVMYLIALCGGTLSLIFLIPFVIPGIGLVLMFSPTANKWLHGR